MRDRLRSWRFYDGFRVDADASITAPAKWAPARRRSPMTAPMWPRPSRRSSRQARAPVPMNCNVRWLTHSTALQSRWWPRTGYLTCRCDSPGCCAHCGLAELSDGTLRFLLWAAALLAPEPPSLMVLNEPETSLHPDLIGPLAMLVRAAAANHPDGDRHAFDEARRRFSGACRAIGTVQRRWGDPDERTRLARRSGVALGIPVTLVSAVSLSPLSNSSDRVCNVGRRVCRYDRRRTPR